MQVVVTKRDVLRESSKIFDPLGLLSPITVRAKILTQNLWKQQYGWDTPLSETIRNEWNCILNDLRECIKLELPRCYFPKSDDTTGNYKLHVFTDASQKAYGACVYIVKGKHSSLVMAKNRVAPLKTITLPRLELMGAVVGARLAKHLIENLGDMEVQFWCDSQIVLKWMSSSKPLKKFLANRIKEIKESVDQQSWKYCPTNANPADLFTRGITAKNFMTNKLWLHGPTWLIDEVIWPTWDGNVTTSMIGVLEQEYCDYTGVDTCTMISVTQNDVGLQEIISLDRFNSLGRLLRVTAYVLRFVKNCRARSRNRITGAHTIEVLNEATTMWITDAQRTQFQDEIKCLENSNRGKKSFIIRQLGLYIDNGVIRCGGRIDNSTLSDTAKHPYLLPQKHRFTALIVTDAHERQLHGGVNTTITHLRQSYWIPRIRQCVKNILRKCLTCRKVTGRAFAAPDPPPLTHDRLKEDVPFKVTGVDFAGPLFVKNRDCSKSKAYICLFTCASSRAVHLEIVPNLTQESFILAFRRFASRRSVPSTMISDNATTFTSASREITDLTHSTTLHDQLCKLGTTWKFIPKRAPWYGGFWERMVGLTKNCLKKVLGRSCVSMDVLQTIITEVESVLNDRPITYISTEINDQEPLTPSHLLCGRRISRLPYRQNNANCDTVELSHRELNSQLIQTKDTIRHFWKRWKNEYLTSLREFHNTTGQNTQHIRVGELVQIEDETPRSYWKLAKITELVTGKDGMVRSVKLSTKSGTTNRPITKLYPLEIIDVTA